MKMNINKCKLLNGIGDQGELVVNGVKVDEIGDDLDFKYLGDYVTKNDVSEEVVKMRKEEMQRRLDAIEALDNQCTNINNDDKKKLFNIFVKPIIGWWRLLDSTSTEYDGSMNELDNLWIEFLKKLGKLKDKKEIKEQINNIIDRRNKCVKFDKKLYEIFKAKSSTIDDGEAVDDEEYVDIDIDIEDDLIGLHDYD